MFIFDQLKREDLALRLVAFGVLGGLVVLLTGLWWIQIVHYRDYQSDLNTQSFRSVRVPAPRGKITDRNGVELANNQPVYNVSLYLEELRGPFQAEFSTRLAAARSGLKAQRLAAEQQLGRKLNNKEIRQFSVSSSNRIAMGVAGRFAVVSNLAAQVGAQIQVPIQLDPEDFGKHYAHHLFAPYPIHKELTPRQVARFEERFAGVPGLALDVETKRVYPSNHLAAHAIGYVQRQKEGVSRIGEESFYFYRLPDFRGLIGIEGGLDDNLCGQAGGKSVLVNNLGYRQEESFWQPTVPGENVVLTLDARLQRAAERALLESGGLNTRGAVVVMDVRNGDILALVSSPTYNPNYYITGFPPGELARIRDEELKPEFNRATQDIYQPGSIFKIVVGMAALELGVNPNETVEVPPHPDNPTKGAYYIGRTPRKDQAGPGRYKFREAFARSSNAVFVDYARRPGVLEKVIELGHKLHLGERAGVPTRQESAGIFPASERIRSGWSSGDTANLAIGQSQLAVTPLQMAVMISAVANGGTVYWPRLVQRLESQDPLNPVATQTFEAKRLRDRLGVSTRTLSIVHDAMLADTEDPDGTGRGAVVPGFRIGGKTGTAQVGDARNRIVDQITWFASYGPWEKPKFAVVVMVESGQSGGTTCTPIARKVYEAIKQIEQPGVPVAALNRN
jgi:penicillin-binding protein 2